MKHPRHMTSEQIEAELNATSDDLRFAALEEELCERRANARTVTAYLEDIGSLNAKAEENK